MVGYTLDRRLKAKGGPDAEHFRDKDIRPVLVARSCVRVNPEAPADQQRKQQAQLARICSAIQEKGWGVYLQSGGVWMPYSPCCAEGSSGAAPAAVPAAAREAPTAPCRSDTSTAAVMPARTAPGVLPSGSARPELSNKSAPANRGGESAPCVIKCRESCHVCFTHHMSMNFKIPPDLPLNNCSLDTLLRSSA
jgi:hypothetical protein